MICVAKKYDPDEPFDPMRRLKPQKKWFADYEREPEYYDFQGLRFINERTAEEVYGLICGLRKSPLESITDASLNIVWWLVGCIYDHDPQFVTEVFKLIVQNKDSRVRRLGQCFTIILQRDQNEVIEKIVFEELLFDPDHAIAMNVAEELWGAGEFGYEHEEASRETIPDTMQYSREDLYRILGHVLVGVMDTDKHHRDLQAD